VTSALAVDNCSVPSNGALFTTKSGDASDMTLTWSTVPTGTFRASMATVTGPDWLMLASGVAASPVGAVDTGMPPMLVTRTNGIALGNGTL